MFNKYYELNILGKKFYYLYVILSENQNDSRQKKFPLYLCNIRTCTQTKT